MKTARLCYAQCLQTFTATEQFEFPEANDGCNDD